MSTANDILDNYQHLVSELSLIPGGKGVFDVSSNGKLFFSKHELDRHANDGEVLELFSGIVGLDVPRYHSS